VGAEGFMNRYVSTLSRGQKQRVALARGIVHQPELLLLDEPFTGLDKRGCAMLEAVIREEQTRGAAVLVVSHDAQLGIRLSAASLRLNRGRVVVNVSSEAD
jgi:ABC-type Mn2+/Zn2+ transport system ATPase subunit